MEKIKLAAVYPCPETLETAELKSDDCIWQKKFQTT
jgi:hypothetical protein